MKVERTAAANNLLLLSEYDRKKKCIDLKYRMRSQQTGDFDGGEMLHNYLLHVAEQIYCGFTFRKV
jgi:hypothetical protein